MPTTVLRYATINDLKTSPKPTGETAALVEGYYAAGDGGGGDFVWDALSTDAENGGTIFASSAGGTGRWKRLLSGPINVKWFGARLDGASDDYDAANAAWNYCRTSGLNLYFPAGTCLVSGDRNFPFRQSDASGGLLDCYNITIHGDGPASVLKTSSVEGADVLQLNGLKNIHFRGLKLLGEVSGSTAGTNGVSITNGWENITFDQIWMENLPGLDKSVYVDGGKGLTIQTGVSANECGSLKATNIFVKGCVEGFGYEPDLVVAAGKKTAIDVELFAEDCYIAVKVVSAAASGPLTAGQGNGLRVRAHAINCQHDLLLNRAHGGEYDVEVVTTKTAAARRLNPDGAAWLANDSGVDTLIAIYAKNARINVRGYKGECDYKAHIGGTTAGSSGLNGATDDCDISLDIGGTSAIADIAAVDSGGNSVSNSRIYVSTVTATSLPDDFYQVSKKNDLQPGGFHTGSFSATLLGVSGVVTANVKYSINDDIVVLEIPTMTGMSNSTSAALMGVPVQIRPTTAQSCVGLVTDNNGNAISRVIVEVGGSITLYNGLSSTFTPSGIKGVQFSTISYRRS